MKPKTLLSTLGLVALAALLIAAAAGVRYVGDHSGLDVGITNAFGVRIWYPGQQADGSALTNVTSVDIDTNGIANNNGFGTNTTIINGTFSGNGSSLTNLNASELRSGMVPAAQIGDLGNGTNISSGSFRFTTPNVTDSGTNWIIDLGVGKGVYKTILATNDICFCHMTNGPGVASVKIYPNGANRIISVPTAWMPYNTNGWALMGNYWQRTLTNAPGTVGPRVMRISICNETASTQTNTDWAFLVTTP